MKSVTLLLGILLSVSGCTPTDPEAARHKAEFQKHLDGVKHYLNDGESARFAKLFLSEVDGGTALCGEVNAKNAFGAYTGFARFVGIGGEALLENRTGQAGMDAAWAKACGKKVYAPG